jgi:hypothetical protein
VNRYIIHLLPEPDRRAILDQLRNRLAERIGWNRALAYPTTHVTLVYDIQDDASDAEPIDPSGLAAVVDRLAGLGSVRLSLRPPEMHGPHLLMPIEDTTQLAATRLGARDGARATVAMPDGRYVVRSARVKEQSWPHLTLAQEIDPRRARQARDYLSERCKGASLPLLATQVALLARDLARSEPYRIIHVADL